MSGTDPSSTSFQQSVEEVRQRIPFVTTIAIEHALRDCNGNVERCISELKKYTDDSRFKRHQSYPQSLTCIEQKLAESGKLSSTWDSSELQQAIPNHNYHTLPGNYRLHPSTNNPISTQQIIAASARQHSDSVDSSSGIERLHSVGETTEQQYPSSRQERLDSLKKVPSLDDIIGAQKRQLESLERRIEMLKQQTEAFKDEVHAKEDRLVYLQSKNPVVNQTKIQEQNSIVLTLEDDVQQLNEAHLYMKKEVEGKWQCAHCTFLNYSVFLECELCHFKKNTVPVWRT